MQYGESRTIGLSYAEEVRWYVQPFRYNTRMWQTDGQTDRINCYINIAHQHCCADVL